MGWFIGYPVPCEMNKGSWLLWKQLSRSVPETKNLRTVCFYKWFFPGMFLKQLLFLLWSLINVLPDYWDTLRHSYCSGFSTRLLVATGNVTIVGNVFSCSSFLTKLQVFPVFSSEHIFELYIFLKNHPVMLVLLPEFWSALEFSQPHSLLRYLLSFTYHTVLRHKQNAAKIFHGVPSSFCIFVWNLINIAFSAYILAAFHLLWAYARTVCSAYL